jgi:hypothetical protein
MPKKLSAPIYAAVVEMNGTRMYSRFSEDLDALIRDAETLYTGIVAIERAHAGEPPVWTRPA